MSTYKWDDKAWRGSRNANVMSAFMHDRNRCELRSKGDGIGIMIFTPSLSVSEVVCHRSSGLDTAKVLAERRYGEFLKKGR